MKYALVSSDNKILREQDFTEAPEQLSAAKGLVWLKLTETIPEIGATQEIGGHEIQVDRNAGSVVRVHIARDKPIEDLVTAKLVEIAADRAAAFEDGMPYVFGGVNDAVQTRPQDQVNLISVWTAAMEADAAGVTDAVIEFRAQSDTSYWLTPQEALAMTAAVRSFGYAIYKASWDRKNALAAIDLNAPDAREQIAAI